MTIVERYSRLPTAAKLLLILSAVLLPIGIALTWLGESGIREANSALEGRTQDQSRAAAKAIESLIARNALALRVAANGVLAIGPGNACDRMARTLRSRRRWRKISRLRMATAIPCAAGDVGDTSSYPLVAPGDIRFELLETATPSRSAPGWSGEWRLHCFRHTNFARPPRNPPDRSKALVLIDGDRELRLVGPPPGRDLSLDSVNGR